MEKILAILSSLHPDINFMGASHLVDEGVLDSLDIVTLITELNRTFDVRIPAREIIPDNFNSPAAMLAMIERIDEV